MVRRAGHRIEFNPEVNRKGTKDTKRLASTVGRASLRALPFFLCSLTADVFGDVTSETNAAVDHLFGMTGRDFDEITDLRYHRARWTDANLGQWLSEDPIGFSAGDENLRRYVGNGTTNATDPSGLANVVRITEYREPPWWARLFGMKTAKEQKAEDDRKLQRFLRAARARPSSKLAKGEVGFIDACFQSVGGYSVTEGGGLIDFQLEEIIEFKILVPTEEELRAFERYERQVAHDRLARSMLILPGMVRLQRIKVGPNVNPQVQSRLRARYFSQKICAADDAAVVGSQRTANNAPKVPPEGHPDFIGPVRPEYGKSPSTKTPKPATPEPNAPRGEVPDEWTRALDPMDASGNRNPGRWMPADEFGSRMANDFHDSILEVTRQANRGFESGRHNMYPRAMVRQLDDEIARVTRNVEGMLDEVVAARVKRLQEIRQTYLRRAGAGHRGGGRGS